MSDLAACQAKCCIHIHFSSSVRWTKQALQIQTYDALIPRRRFRAVLVSQIIKMHVITFPETILDLQQSHCHKLESAIRIVRLQSI